MIVVRLAWRNLFLHRNKTLVLGLIVAVGLYILVLGNSLMDTVTRGLERTYTAGFTGDLAVVPTEGDPALFSVGNADPLGALPDYPALLQRVAEVPGVEVSPQVQTRALVSTDEREGTGTVVLGIDPGAYRRVFPDNLVLVEGQFLTPGQTGVLLSQRTRDLLREQGHEVEVGRPVVLSNRNPATGFKAREVPLVGVFRFASDISLVQRISLVDGATARALAGLKSVSTEVTPVAELSDPEAGFDQFELVTDAVQGSAVEAVTQALAGGRSTSADDADAWNVLLVRTAPGSDPAQVRAALNGLPGLRVLDWVATVGPLAELMVNLKLVFNLLVLVVGLVALLVIMNALVISVTERVPEIGTIRALGASRSFVRGLITGETLLTSVVFGLVGMGAAVVTLVIFGAVGFQAPNEVVAVLIGGRFLRPEVSVGSLVQALILVATVGLLASLYPVSVALRISPVTAMQSN